MKDEIEISTAFVKATDDLIQNVKADGSIGYVNPAWLYTLGYNIDEVSNIKLQDIIYPGFLLKTEEAILRVLKGHRIKNFVTTLVSKNEIPVQVEGQLFPYYNEKKVVSVVGVFQNTTDQNRIVDELLHEQDRVENLLDLLTHDLTGINQEILSTIEIALFSPNLPQALEHLLRESLHEVERGSNLISNVKKLWQIARKIPRLFSCDLGETLFAAKKAVASAYPQKEMELTTNIETRQYYVTADEYLFEIIKNLLQNIMKFDIRDKVQVEVEVETVSHTPFLKMQIKDHGPGIFSEGKLAIFDQLSQKQAGPRGLGLGLTLAKHVLENYGGYIRVEDRVEGEPDQGANFILLLHLSKIKSNEAAKKGGSP
jgi:PAS domain S-box-containing protein